MNILNLPEFEVIDTIQDEIEEGFGVDIPQLLEILESELKLIENLE